MATRFLPLAICAPPSALARLAFAAFAVLRTRRGHPFFGRRVSRCAALALRVLRRLAGRIRRSRGRPIRRSRQQHRRASVFVAARYERAIEAPRAVLAAATWLPPPARQRADEYARSRPDRDSGKLEWRRIEVLVRSSRPSLEARERPAPGGLARGGDHVKNLFGTGSGAAGSYFFECWRAVVESLCASSLCS